MKTFLFLILALVSSLMIQAQAGTETSYLDRDMVVVNKSDSSVRYIRYTTQRNGKIFVEDHYKNDALYMTGSYYRLLPREIPDGHFIYYSEKGIKTREYSYADSLREGDEITRDSLGHKEYEMHYTHGRLDGPLKGYYPSGKLHRDEMYKDSTRVSGKCYDEAGNEQAYYPRLEEPEFPGGETGMMHFIRKNLTYPDFERENDIQGRLLIKFDVMEDGSVSDIRVTRHVSKGIDDTGVNLVKRFPKFKPGKKEGKTSRMVVILPLMFKLASQ